MNQTHTNSFGNWLRTERESHGVSRFNLGWKAGVGFWAIGRLDDGKSLPDARAIRSISEIFGVSADDIATMAGVPRPVTNGDLVEILGNEAHRLDGFSDRSLADLRSIADRIIRKDWEDYRRKNDMA